MSTEVSRLEFSRLCDVSRVAVSKAEKRGSVVATERGKIDIAHKKNLTYLRHRLDRKSADQIAVQGRVAPGWAALCAEMRNGKVKPLYLLQPHPLSDDDAVDLSPAGWDLDTTDEWIVRDPQGREYPAVLVYDRESPPPWLNE